MKDSGSSPSFDDRGMGPNNAGLSFSFRFSDFRGPAGDLPPDSRHSLRKRAMGSSVRRTAYGVLLGALATACSHTIPEPGELTLHDLDLATTVKIRTRGNPKRREMRFLGIDGSRALFKHGSLPLTDITTVDAMVAEDNRGQAAGLGAFIGGIGAAAVVGVAGSGSSGGWFSGLDFAGNVLLAALGGAVVGALLGYPMGQGETWVSVRVPSPHASEPPPGETGEGKP